MRFVIEVARFFWLDPGFKRKQALAPCPPSFGFASASATARATSLGASFAPCRPLAGEQPDHVGWLGNGRGDIIERGDVEANDISGYQGMIAITV